MATFRTTTLGCTYLEASSKNYTFIAEPQLSEKLVKLSAPRSISGIDAVSFQPATNPNEASQDRYVVQEWTIGNRTWKFSAIFDGHAGHEIADYAVEAIAPSIKHALVKETLDKVVYDAELVSKMLVDAIASVDDALADALYALFPNQDVLEKLSDKEIREIINDSDRGGVNHRTVIRCMRGSTILISLLDTEKRGLWVASLGDCHAVLGTKKTDGRWDVAVVSSNHNGADSIETERIRNEHPHEEECIKSNRVLGAIAVTRALGDHTFKLPRAYTDRVFLNAVPGYRVHSSVEAASARNFTPPYLSNIADVSYISLQPSEEHLLIMASDGLSDLFCEDVAELDMLTTGREWVKALSDSAEGGNAALRLLRYALGGGDEDKVCQWLNVESESRWMDDTTILVQSLR